MTEKVLSCNAPQHMYNNIYIYIYIYIYLHVSMRDEKEERSKQGQTNNKAKQHSTPKAVTLQKKELPQVRHV